MCETKSMKIEHRTGTMLEGDSGEEGAFSVPFLSSPSLPLKVKLISPANFGDISHNTQKSLYSGFRR